MDEDLLLEPPAEYSSRTRSGRAAMVSGVGKAPAPFTQQRLLTNDAWKRDMDVKKLEVNQEAKRVARLNADVALAKAGAQLAEGAFKRQSEVEELNEVASIFREGLPAYTDPDYQTKKAALLAKYPRATKNAAVQQSLKQQDDWFTTHYGNQRQDNLRRQAEGVAVKEGLKPQDVTVDMGDSAVRMGVKEKLAEEKLTAREQAALTKAKAQMAKAQAELGPLEQQLAGDKMRALEGDTAFHSRLGRLRGEVAAAKTLLEEYEPTAGNVAPSGGIPQKNPEEDKALGVERARITAEIDKALKAGKTDAIESLTKERDQIDLKMTPVQIASEAEFHSIPTGRYFFFNGKKYRKNEKKAAKNP